MAITHVYHWVAGRCHGRQVDVDGGVAEQRERTSIAAVVATDTRPIEMLAHASRFR